MSTFDADAFLNQEIDANFESEFTPIPEGEWEAQLEKLTVSSYTAKQGDDAGQEKPILKPTWIITDPSVAEETGIDQPRVTQAIFLDFKDGVLEEGTNKNVMLGKLREIAGKTDNPFVLTDLTGMSAIVNVKHRILEDGRPAAEVRGVAEI